MLPLSVAKLLCATSATHPHTSKAKAPNLFMGCYLNGRPGLNGIPKKHYAVLSLARMAPAVLGLSPGGLAECFRIWRWPLWALHCVRVLELHRHRSVAVGQRHFLKYLA